MFNRWSRWDKAAPVQAAEERGEEPVSVGAVFTKGQVIPQYFLWQGRRITVREVTYRWLDRVGNVLLYYIAVTDGANAYELCYNTQRLTWHLTQVQAIA